MIEKVCLKVVRKRNVFSDDLGFKLLALEQSRAGTKVVRKVKGGAYSKYVVSGIVSSVGTRLFPLREKFLEL